jgi:putative methanogen marker protein 4
MFSLSELREMAKKNHIRVGIGGEGSVAVERTLEKVEKAGLGKITVYNDAETLVMALKDGRVDAAVRGSLSAKNVMESLKLQLGVDSVLRIALLKRKEDELVMLAPVGVDEGQSQAEKLELINQACKLLLKFQVDAKVGVLSGGRLEDMGRDVRVDKTLREGDSLAQLAQKKGISANHFGIELEDAFEYSNVVIAPDGITGNLIFRALHFMAGAKGIGAPVVNISKVFVDTSRSKKDFTDSVALAGALWGLDQS